MAEAFSRLGLAFEEHPDRFAVTPPSYRFDLEIEEDLIEEVARLFGFERIPADPPRAAAQMRLRREEQRSAHDVRRALARDGYQELVNYSFVDAAWEQDFAGNPDPIRVLNPIASQMSVMRTTLVGGLVAALGYNLNRKQSRARLFEVGSRLPARCRSGRMVRSRCRAWRSRPSSPGSPTGRPTTSSGASPPRDVDFFDVKGDVERLFAPAAVRFVRAGASGPASRDAVPSSKSNGATVGFVGELHPRLQQKYELPKPAVVFEVDLAPLLARPLPALQRRFEVPAGDAGHFDHGRRRRCRSRRSRTRWRPCRTPTAACRRSGNFGCSTCIVLEPIQAKSPKRVLTPC